MTTCEHKYFANIFQFYRNSHFLVHLSFFIAESNFLSANKITTEVGFRPISEIPRYQPVDITEHLQQLDGDVRDYTMQLQSEK